MTDDDGLFPSIATVVAIGATGGLVAMPSRDGAIRKGAGQHIL